MSAAADGGAPAGPAPAGEDAAQRLLSEAALTAFRLNGRFLAVAEDLARPAGLTAAWWQVLGAVLRAPLPVAEVARAMGITRQSVQRVADLLVAKGLAEYRPNPAHRRAKLLAPTAEGRAAVQRIDPAHHALAHRLAAELGPADLAAAVAAMRRLGDALEEAAAAPPPAEPAGA
ncbi:MarR family winged helix-turn-helix transcriptional regulator [Streptomonospora nanhaiensis]|uniref:DNA-binding MarR family transcriptional regulator n=1 Tax=Streptomonospora nanhaiensis TaxID=1323731 RepID=A0A853BM42_9ACTN|nr:MarR family transcriptional regulator [Streptomonospora nanhaiensis]MBV2363287.1 MarR family transcriptional regulator [Streptomonospora nanhaiensis]MBX9389913.1 MarR family transcriptional regulator [Streptomonospora nanhaiensis]NYI95646.1 DNA-binding MarR family transcriptional regulator [Streptomonospora nanhaiensis]